MRLSEPGFGQAFGCDDHAGGLGLTCHGSKQDPARSRAEATGKIEFSDGEE
jgi:hypothetical protein